MRTALLLIVCGTAFGQLPQTPQSVVDFIAGTASALSEAHSIYPTIPSSAEPFLESFDPNMPGFTTLRDDVESLVAEAEVSSSIEISGDQGNETKRALELDWILQIENQPMRRKIIKCTIEKEKTKWKFTSFEPLDFFKP